MTVSAFNRLAVEGLEEALVVAWSGRASLCAPFCIEARAVVGAVDAADVLGASAKLTLADDHVIVGVVEAVRRTPAGTVFTIVPPVARLADSESHRVVLDTDGLSLAKQVFDEHGIEIDERVGSPPTARPQRVQAFESDLAFVTRLLAEEGISWCVDQDGEGSSKVVIRAGAGALEPIAGDAKLTYRSADSAGMVAGEGLSRARLKKNMATDRVTVRDYNFAKPEVDLSADASVGAGALEAYRFVGPGWYADTAAGKQLAQRLLDAERCESLVLEATSTCTRLWPGRTFELADAPRDDMNQSWQVIAVELVGHEHQPGDAPRFEAHIRAIPADVPWRPPVNARPSLGGVHTAVITGAAGEEIHTDEHGRVRAKLRYDKDKAADDKASAWSRVLQPPTTGGVFLPRTGWEALMAFTSESGDEPYVLGRLDNGGSPTAEALPGNKVCSNFGTPTTPGGGSANMMRMTDSAGGEDMGLVASADWNEQTAINKSTAVKGSMAKNIGGNHDLVGEAARGLKVDGTQTVSVSGNRVLTAASGIVTQAGSEMVMVGGTRDFSVGGDQATKVGGALSRSVGAAKVTVAIAGNNRHVDAASTMVVGGAWVEAGATGNMSVAGLSTLTCSATSISATKYSLQATALNEACGARTETAPKIGYTAKGAINLTFAATNISAPTVVVKAASITITAAGGILSVKPGSVTFVGALKASGHVRSKGNAEHG